MKNAAVPESPGPRFIEETKHKNQRAPSDQQLGAPAPSVEAPRPGSEPIALPRPDALADPEVAFRSLIEQRRSVRRYADASMSLDELSYLLWCTQGVVRELGDGVGTLRNVPSAGARHALETSLLVNEVDGLEPGLYRYLAIDHALAPMDAPDRVALDVTHACYDQFFIAESAVTFLWWAVPYRMAWRYGDRAYRYLHLDAGHVCQNLYLAAESIGCGVCAVAAFDDDALSTILGLDGRDAFAIYVAAAGKKTDR